MRRRLARWLRVIANRLHPDPVVEVFVRPVIVGDEDMAHTLRVLLQVERARLGLPPEWPEGKLVVSKKVVR